MHIAKWFHQLNREIRGNLRFRFFLLIFLSIFPGTMLLIHSVITQQHQEVFTVFLIVISSLLAIWLGADVLILRSIKSIDELARSLDGMATSLEEKTDELEWRNDMGEAFSEIVNEFAAQHDISTLLQLIVDKVMALLNTSYTVISLYDASRLELEFVAVSGNQVPVGTRIRIGEGIVGCAAENRQLLIVDEYDLWEGRLPEFEAYAFKTVVQVPMVYRDELIGVLGVAETGTVRKFDESEIRLMKLSAGAAASAIRNARSFTETFRRLQELEAINAVSTAMRVAQTLDEMLPVLLEKTMSVTSAIMGSIWLYDTVDHSLHQVASNGIPPLTIRFKPGEGIFGMVFSTAQPYFTTEWREDPLIASSGRSQIPKGLSGAFFPIRTAQSTIGVLMVGFHSPHEFLEDEKHVLSTITEIAGNAIYRMKLHDQTKRQVQQLNALHQIDLAITGAPDTSNMLQILLDQVITQLQVDAVSVLVFDPNQQALEFAASQGFRTDALHSTRLRFGGVYVDQVALDQGTIFIPDLKILHTDHLHPPFLNAEGFISYLAVPLVSKSQIQGVLEIFHRSLLNPDAEWMDFLEVLANQAALMIGYARLLDDLQGSNIELNLAYDSTLEGWSRALEVRDQETNGHSQRVAEMTLRLAKLMEIPEQDLVHVRRGALLHDVGKLGIPDHILLKPGPLTEEETVILRRHPAIAYEMLTPIRYLHPALDIPYFHHEKWDGTGYPLGLKKEEIPLPARIFAVVDVWDALTSDRPYRKAWSEAEALAYIQQQAGVHFDPQVVDAFLHLMSRKAPDAADAEANSG